MGRPLHKKYFGNRNIGRGGNQITGNLSNSQNYADDRIGGQGIASISFSNQGNFAANGTATPLVGLALPAPTIPGGVQATGTITYEVSTVTTGAGSVGLIVGDTYTFAGTGDAVFTVATSGNDASNATFTVTNRGTGVASIPNDSITVSMTKLTGAGAATFTVDVYFRVKSFVIVEQGSGYTGAETITVTLGANAVGTVPVCTEVLTADTGAVGSSTNQENAILMTAFLTGGSATTVDIIKQVSGRRYKVTDGTRTGIVALQSTLANAAGEGSIAATDSAGGEYFVTKLTAHRATLTRAGGSGWLYATGAAAPWKFDAPAGIYVQIANA
jgi:hypothetical protein